MEQKYHSIGVKFYEPQLDKCRALSREIEMSQSMVVRAALQLGLEQIDESLLKSTISTKNLIKAKDAKSKL